MRFCELCGTQEEWEHHSQEDEMMQVIAIHLCEMCRSIPAFEGGNVVL